MTDEQIKKLADKYKTLKAMLKVDRDLQKQGVWGFISSEDLPNVIDFIKTFEEKILSGQEV